ncbi:SA1362 family protein [Bacillus massiliigorillae]|uniref:SA1362 family protein n=1 Tax=Bacillus massiliigorillae TaxID=1243664 RepID=UPI0003A1C997|nr:SA1362 family protein [Bacillus massiliigorillae]
MMKRPSYFIVSGIILLALLGLGSKLFGDPVGTLKWLLIIVAVTAIMIYVVKRFSGSSTAQSANQKAYRKAAKQSQKNQQLRNTSKPKDSNVVTYSFNHSKRKPKHRKKSDVQLTVIDGKKGKKKNRA